MIEVALSMEPMPSEATAKTKEPIEVKRAVVPIPCLAGCGQKFLPNRRQTKYCSKKCANHAAMRLWRERNKPVFLPKNCEMCGDEFSPIRKWQRFCHHDCMILWQNNYGRARHQNIYGVFYSEFFKLYIVNEKKDVLEKEVLSTDPHIRDIHVLKKCASPVCKCLCKIVKRQYSDKPDRIVSWQVGWTYDEKLDELACKSCQIRFEIISDNNYKQGRTSQVVGQK